MNTKQDKLILLKPATEDLANKVDSLSLLDIEQMYKLEVYLYKSDPNNLIFSVPLLNKVNENDNDDLKNTKMIWFQ